MSWLKSCLGWVAVGISFVFFSWDMSGSLPKLCPAKDDIQTECLPTWLVTMAMIFAVYEEIRMKQLKIIILPLLSTVHLHLLMFELQSKLFGKFPPQIYSTNRWWIIHRKSSVQFVTHSKHLQKPKAQKQPTQANLCWKSSLPFASQDFCAKCDRV